MNVLFGIAEGAAKGGTVGALTGFAIGRAAKTCCCPISDEEIEFFTTLGALGGGWIGGISALPTTKNQSAR